MHQLLESQLRATLNMIPAYTWYTTPSGGLIFVNERNADYGGLPSDHPLRYGTDTSPAWDSHIPFLHPEDHEETRRVWSECLRTGRPGEVSFRARNAEGGYRWFLSRAEPLRANDGTILYWIGVNFDIQERKQAESEIRRQEDELRQMLDLAPQHVGVLGADGRPLYANRVALEYFGVTIDTWRALPRPMIRSKHPDWTSFIQTIASTFSTRGGSGFSKAHPTSSKPGCEDTTERSVGSSSGSIRSETTADKSHDGTAPQLTSMIARALRRDSYKRTSRFGRKSIRRRCSKRSSALHPH